MTAAHHGMSRFDLFLKTCLEGHALNAPEVLPQTFGWLLGENPVTGNLPDGAIVDAFDALVDAMLTDDIADGPADAGMTFFGQFVDHDVTLDATSSIGTRIDPRHIRNIRTPNLDLDCVYGDGPEASPHLYSPDHHGFLLFGREANPRDLARNGKGTALIGDPRNDENVIVSQIQGAFVTLHNILMARVEDGGDDAHDIHACASMGMRSDLWQDAIIPPRLRDFEEVRRFVRLHYQWIVLNELLPAFVERTALEAALWDAPFGPLMPVMPVEFSGAAYRFGHATVQPSYRMTAGGDPVDLFATQGFGPRDPASDLEFGAFFGPGAQKALPVGTKMARTLFSLPFVNGTLRFRSVETTPEQAAKLALRNILRDRGALHLSAGQDVARHLGIAELEAPAILRDRHVTKTPLWFYCLQEAEEQGGGRLTGAGAAIVGAVFGRLLSLDSASVVHLGGFTPWSGFGGAECSMAGLMAFVEANRDAIPQAADLRCG